MNPAQLLEHFNRISEAPDAVARLRRFILDLAVCGKLVEQDPNDEPAAELLKRIQAEKARLVKEGRLKKTMISLTVESLNVPFDLPLVWAWTCLGDVAQYGISDKVDSNIDIAVDTWVLDLEDIEKGTSRLIERTYSLARPFRSTKTIFKHGDVLFGKLRPYLNKVLVADQDGVCTTEIIPIRGYCGMVPEYMKLVLKSSLTMARVDRLMYGMKMPRLGTGDAVALSFPLPPLAEQHRIVAKVDVLMALCDQLEAAQSKREKQRDRLVAASLYHVGTALPESLPAAAHFHLDNLPHLTTRPEHIKQLRQTILNLAVRGRLVPQDPNDEPAVELLERIKTHRDQLLNSDYPNAVEARSQLKKQSIQVVCLPSGLERVSTGWQWATLMQCSALVVDCHNKTAPYSQTGIPLIRTTNVRDGKINLKEPKFVDELSYARWSARCEPEPGDILITREAPMGEVAVIPDGMKICLGQRMMLARLVPKTICPQYMLQSLRDPLLMDRVQDKPVGATVQHLRVGGVETLLVPLPPLAEQHRIVAKVDELMVLCDQLEAQLATTRTDSRRLLEAVLRDALDSSVVAPG